MAGYHGQTRFFGAVPGRDAQLHYGLRHIGGTLLQDKVTGTGTMGPRAPLAKPRGRRRAFLTASGRQAHVVKIVIERVQFAAAAHHVASTLHTQPCRKRRVSDSQSTSSTPFLRARRARPEWRVTCTYN